jgi:hypothetical protein
MAQRKKKPSGYQIQSITQAQHRNEFMRKLKSFINSVSGEDIYSLLPAKILERIYKFRFHSLMIVPAAGNQLPIKSLKTQKYVISKYLKKEILDLPKYGLKVLLDDYMTIGLTVFAMCHTIQDNDFPDAAKVRSTLLNYCNDDEPFSLLHQRLFSIFNAIIWSVCTIETGFYWFIYETKLAEKGKSGMNNIVEANLQLSESIRIKINGTVRPAIRLGWANPFEGIDWIMLKPSALNIKDALTDDPMKVYIQSHALLRLADRIDSIDASMAQYNMYTSFLDAKVCYDNFHNLMIEYRIFGTRAGYFRIDIVEKVVVVRTFLFLTQSSTPEGRLLLKNAGLQKLDTSYLAIDKLSSFMSSDIGNNENIRKMFENSGCQCLLGLYNRVNKICTKQSTQPTIKLMLEYLGYNEKLIPEEVFD